MVVRDCVTNADLKVWRSKLSVCNEYSQLQDVIGLRIKSYIGDIGVESLAERLV